MKNGTKRKCKHWQETKAKTVKKLSIKITKSIEKKTRQVLVQILLRVHANLWILFNHNKELASIL
jgi:hypothetical protein